MSTLHVIKHWKAGARKVNFGAKLKSLRKGSNLTQQQLADRLGVAKSVVSYYESGNRYPSYDVLVRIARIFHTTTDYLLDIDRKKVIDVSDLSDDEVSVITQMIDILKKKGQSE
ncbi:MAG: helix-turn-helix domain-containing protein [Lachnospiraceae bacterium]|nr:helix-turn-helix domain-containing protein [Lachnospiraceae bacterium]